MEITGNTFTVVPHGWQRLMEGGRVVYISPDNKKLWNNEELLRHMTTPGTCKCGLKCPFSIDELFSFDPEMLSLPDNRPYTQDALCRQANHLRLVKNRRPQATKKQVSSAGLHSVRKKSGRQSTSSMLNVGMEGRVAASAVRLDGGGGGAGITQPMVQLQSLISHLNTMVSRSPADSLSQATIPLQWLAAAGIQLQAPVTGSSLSGTSKTTQQIAFMIPSSLSAASLTPAASTEQWRVAGKIQKDKPSRSGQQAGSSQVSSSSSSPTLEDSESLSSHCDDPAAAKFPTKSLPSQLLLSHSQTSLTQSLPVSSQTDQWIPPHNVTESASLPDEYDGKEKSGKQSPTNIVTPDLTTTTSLTSPCPITSPSQSLATLPQARPSSILLSPDTSPSQPLATLPQAGPSSTVQSPETSPFQPLATLPQADPSSGVLSPETNSSQPLATLPQAGPSSIVLSAKTSPSQPLATLPEAGLSSVVLSPETSPSQPLATLPRTGSSSIVLSSKTSPSHPLSTLPKAGSSGALSPKTSPSQSSATPPSLPFIIPSPDTSLSQPLTGPSSVPLPPETNLSKSLPIQPLVEPSSSLVFPSETSPSQSFATVPQAGPSSPVLAPEVQSPEKFSAVKSLSLPACAHSPETALHQHPAPFTEPLPVPVPHHVPSVTSESGSDDLTEAGTSETQAGASNSQAGSCTSQTGTTASQASAGTLQTGLNNQSFHLHSSNANNNNVPHSTQGFVLKESAKGGDGGALLDLGQSKNPADYQQSGCACKSYNLRARSSSRDSSEPPSNKSTTSSSKSQSDESSLVLPKGQNQLLDSAAVTVEDTSFVYPALVCSEFNLRKRKERSSSVASSDRKSSASPTFSSSIPSVPSSQSSSKISGRTRSRLKSDETNTTRGRSENVCSASTGSASRLGKGDSLSQENTSTAPVNSPAKKPCLPTGKQKQSMVVQFSRKRLPQKRKYCLLECYSVTDFTEGDVVWAKAPQLPAWPGHIITPSQWTKDELEPPPAGEVWVEWFGSKTVSLVPVDNLQPLRQGYQSAQRKIKKTYTKKIKKAMKEALVALEVREQQKAASANR